MPTTEIWSLKALVQLVDTSEKVKSREEAQNGSSSNASVETSAESKREKPIDKGEDLGKGDEIWKGEL